MFSLTPARGLAVPLRDSQSLLPLPAVTMAEMWDFIAMLARAAKIGRK
jgi:diadenosine tetraphosphate (Ap4A) HIT family hydrolase